MEAADIQAAQAVEARSELVKAMPLDRIIAKSVDFIIVAILVKTIPTAGFLAGIAYLALADGLFQGRSLGKKLIGLKVVYLEGGNAAICGYKESVIRNIPFTAAYVVSGILGIIPLLGWVLSFIINTAILIFESLVMFGSEEGMRLGDEIAKTQVVPDREGKENVK